MKFTYPSGARPLQGYAIRRGLGRGGFGEVYRGVSDGGKEVALKLVQQHLEVELWGVRQCLNLKHPNLVVVHDILRAEERVLCALHERPEHELADVVGAVQSMVEDGMEAEDIEKSVRAVF